MNIIIFGPQGSGKGTQAELISKELELLHVESGQILRDKTKTDKRIKKMLDEGIIVPDEETLSYIEEYVEEKEWSFENIIFDGYPRKISQYHLLRSWLGDRGTDVDIVLYLDISEEESIKRLSSRRVCSECNDVYNLITKPPKKKGVCIKCEGELIQRHDDIPEVISKRLKNYHKSTKPILDVARKDGLLIEIDGERPIDEIYKDIIERLKSKKNEK